jgi:hypothetical protein
VGVSRSTGSVLIIRESGEEDTGYEHEKWGPTKWSMWAWSSPNGVSERRGLGEGGRGRGLF